MNKHLWTINNESRLPFFIAPHKNDLSKRNPWMNWEYNVQGPLQPQPHGINRINAKICCYFFGPNKYTDHAGWLHLFVCPIYLVHWLCCRTFFRFNLQCMGTGRSGRWARCIYNLFKTPNALSDVPESSLRIYICIWFKKQKPGGGQSELESKTRRTNSQLYIYFEKVRVSMNKYKWPSFVKHFLSLSHNKTGLEKILYISKNRSICGFRFRI